MSAIGEIVARLIAAGTPPDLAAVAVAEAFAEGAMSAQVRGIPPDISTEKRRAYDRQRKRKLRGIPPESTGNSADVQNALLKKEDFKKERKKHGERIPPDWKPSEHDEQYARSKGIPPDRIPLEAEKFKNWWSAKSGKDAVKIDWSATWRNWVLSWLERNPNAAPTAPPNKQPAYLTPPPGAPSLEECLRPYRNAKAAGTQVRDDAGVGANGADRSAELPLSGGAALPAAGKQARGHPPDDFP